MPSKSFSPEEGWNLYKARYTESLVEPDKFWSDEAQKYISWFSPFTSVMEGTLDLGDVNWFANGKLNACYNCIDKHVSEKGDQVAIIWEGDEPDLNKKITYRELKVEVSRIANVMKSKGVKKGDVVTIYMPMIPELAMTMLACARIGAIHSVVFAGFSAESLKGRILDCNSKFLFTTDEGLRGGKAIKLKGIADTAIAGLPDIITLVYTRTGAPVQMTTGRDFSMTELLPSVRGHCPCEPMDSEDPLFILYTSGSTGKPKGVVHHTAGYLLNAAMTTNWSFDLQENDIYCCVADCGWITGHTYIVYGPLCNGATTIMFESVPTHPNPYRYWDLVQKHKVTQFYTAPTAIRTLMRFDTEPINQYDLSSLRVLGSVGEPINPEAWKWYDTHVGKGKCSVVDTYWQTETGSHVCANLPGVIAAKPGSCSLPCYGIDFAVLDPVSGKELEGNDVEGVLCIRSPWPSMARSIYGDHDRYLSVYTRPYPGMYINERINMYL